MKTKNWGLGKKLLASLFILTFIMAFSSSNLLGKEIIYGIPEDAANDNAPIPKPIKLDDALFGSGPSDLIPVIVRFSNRLQIAGYAQLEQEIGKFTTKYQYNIIPGMAADLTKEQIEALKNDPKVEAIEYDNRVQAFLDTSTYWFGADAIATDYGLTGAGMAIAVIDTGIDPGHADLDGGKIIGWKDYVNGLTTPYDDHGHGTHVSSIAAGAGHGNPIYKGVAPGASLVGVKVLNSGGSGLNSDVIAAIDWCVTNKNAFLYPIKVMNLSLGSGGSSDGTDSVCVACNNAMDAGIVVVLAAGNDGPATYTIGSPAAAAKPVTVGAMSDLGKNGFYLAGYGPPSDRYSSRGPTADGRIKPDVSAPGVNIMAAQYGTTTGYVQMSGTSMASPFVAGISALILQRNPTFTPALVKSRIMSTAQDWGPSGLDIDYGSGRLDGYKTISVTTSKPTVPSHVYQSASLTGSGDFDLFEYNITNITYPIAVTLVMTDWPGRDFDLQVLNPSGTVVGSSTAVKRQETIGIMPTVTGHYKVKVYSYSGSGDYFFDISAGIGVNRAPVAVNNSYNVNKNTVLTVPIPGVLINDTDPDGDSLSAVLVTPPNPLRGTLVLNSNGSFTYTPALNYVGLDSFTYKAYDGLLYSNVVTVTITVNPVNRAPIAVNDGSYIMNDGVGGYIVSVNGSITLPGPGVLGNDSDPDGDPLTAIKVTDPANGVVMLNSNGSFTYTPTAAYAGNDSFTYKANDGLLDSNVATVLLIVTPKPIAVDDNYRGNKNAPLIVSVPGVLGNDTDTYGNPLTAIRVTNPIHGTLTAFSSNGSFTYSPTVNYVGLDSFTYKVNNGLSDSLPATVGIKVNGAPVAVLDGYRFNMNTVLIVPSPGVGVLGNDTDPNGDTLTAVLVTPPNPLRGTLVLNPDGSFTYTPVAGYVGLDSFTYKAYDGLLYSNIVTVTIKVNGPPVAVNDSYRVNNGTTLIVPARGVLTNDRDPNSDPFTAVLVIAPVRHTGTFILNADGSFTYTPVVGYVGTDSFTYKANDGLLDSTVVTVTIKVNGPPVAVADIYRVNINTTLTIPVRGVLTNDTDPNLDLLTALKISDPAHGAVTLNANGSFIYTPALNYVGLDVLTYKANDGLLDSNIATVTIKVNGPPLAVNDGIYMANKNISLTIPLPGVLANDTDPNSDTLTAIKVISPLHGTVTQYANGAFTYVPALNYVGPDSFTYKAYDGLLYSNEATVNIKVNGAPIAVLDGYRFNKNTVLTVPAPGVLDNDTDPEGEPLTAVLVTTTNPLRGTLVLSSNGSFTYTPVAGYVGLDSFTYKAYDGLLYSNIVTVTIKVNGPPVAVNNSYRFNMNTTLTVPVRGVLTNDTDPNVGDLLTAVLVTPPVRHIGTFILNADGSFTYTPVAGYVGLDNFTYKANDGLLDSTVVTVTIKVNGPPVAVADSYRVNMNTTLTVPTRGVLTNDTDPNLDLLTAVLVSVPAGTLTLNTNGSFTYTPVVGYVGIDSFTYKANDGLLDSNVVTVTIKVNGAPVAVNDSYNVNMNAMLSVPAPGVLANDTDPNSDTLTAVKVINPAHGTLTAFSTTGSFTYTPVVGYVGPDSFTYKAYDVLLYSNEATVTITVIPPVIRTIYVATTGNDGNDGTSGKPYLTIQKGIDVAINGDTVLVGDGTYKGVGNTNLDFKGKIITVKSNNDARVDPEKCIIDCENTPNTRGFYFHSKETAQSVVQGFTIQNGNADYGGGILCTNVSIPHIFHCVIRYNKATIDGGGIACRSTSYPTINYSDVSNNSAVKNGGGMSTDTTSKPGISYNKITYNSAEYGGGIFYNGAPLTGSIGLIDANWIKYNSAVYGAGINCQSSSPRINNNQIAKNTATEEGGGIQCYMNSAPIILNCTITDNLSGITGSEGISCSANGSPTIINTIIWTKVPDGVPNGIYFKGTGAANTATISYSDVDPITIITNGNGTIILGVGNINVDPKLRNYVTEDYSLLNSSPCIGAGTNSGAPTKDLLGGIRPNPSGSNADMGAIENSLGVPLAVMAAPLANLSFEPLVPKTTRLAQNYPNPFNPETWIPFALSNDTNVEIMIYASSGQLVRSLDLGHKSAGSYTERDKSAYWDGKNEAGEFVGSGIYFYTIKAGNFVATRKMVMMK